MSFLQAAPAQQLSNNAGIFIYLGFLVLIALLVRSARRNQKSTHSPSIKSVLLVIGQLGRGGAEKQLILLANSLASSGVRTTLVSFHGGERREQVSPEVKLVILQEKPPERIPWVLTVTPKLWAVIWFYQPQVVIAFLLYAYLTAIPCAALSTNAIRVSARRSLGYFKHISWVLLLERLVNAVTNLVIANSKSVADFAIKQEGLDENRVEVIRNVLTDEWFLDSTTANQCLVVLNVANLIAYKGQETLLKSFAQVQIKYPQAVLRIIGDGPERGSIEALAKTLSVKLEITGAQPVTAANYQGVGVFVLSSREEGMSNSLMEAMAAGLPIVATDVGGNAETLGDSGVLVNPGNETELAQALLGLLADEHKARALGARARERARSFFTNRNLAHEYLQAIQESSSR
jgi:glycosyltransferase involved in cell wall biosynthesis